MEAGFGSRRRGQGAAAGAALEGVAGDGRDPRCHISHRLIRMVMENAHKQGKWVGICGELGADLELTEEFVRMGIDELSVAPSMILKIRKEVRDMDAYRFGENQ
ncbi:MAG: hypothetical protein HFI32_14710 [Lachnospiraceae bacterium]|nr:hypothetical protein [Lachnospiraceae bacterium]